jgi:peptide deformylase
MFWPAQQNSNVLLINPSITVISDQQEEDWEGCLSVPGIRAKVPRYKKIRYSGSSSYLKNGIGGVPQYPF